MNNAKQITKEQLAEWLTDQNDDCGRDTFFSSDLRNALTTDESYEKFMDMSKDELISLIEGFSEEGQSFLATL
jgi:hypothetical protein